MRIESASSIPACVEIDSHIVPLAEQFPLPTSPTNMLRNEADVRASLATRARLAAFAVHTSTRRPSTGAAPQVTTGLWGRLWNPCSEPRFH